MYKLHHIQNIVERVFIFNETNKESIYRIEMTFSDRYINLYFFEGMTASEKIVHPYGSKALMPWIDSFFKRCELMTKEKK